MAKRITEIPATLNRFTSAPVISATKRKVAGYARVSTDLEEQQTSYEAQMDYYKNYITSRNDWEFVGMYSDEGITATNTKYREGFNRMVADALAGKIDLIITKSISRFARNTVDSLTTVRKLKDRGVEVFFEKENIWTLDSKGELLITIMSSLAQEESRSISENTTWGKRKAFADGKASVAYTHFLGYDKGFVINEEEADTIRLIYKLYLSGLSMNAITKELKRRGKKTPFGKENWCIKTIKSILTNEKYKGCALLQKQYTVDFLQKTKRKNNGEVPQYFVEEHHAPIISPEIFELVQAEMQKRTSDGTGYSSWTPFSSKIKCGECDGWYGPKIWHSTDKYRRVVYQCNKKYKGSEKCTTPHLTEDEIKTLFLRALNMMISEKEEVLANLNELIQDVADVDEMKEERERIRKEIGDRSEAVKTLVAENAKKAQDQTDYDLKYQALYEQYEQTVVRLNDIEADISRKITQRTGIQEFIRKLSELQEVPTAFNEQLWRGIVDHMTVYARGRIVITFIGDIDVTVGL